MYYTAVTFFFYIIPRWEALTSVAVQKHSVKYQHSQKIKLLKLFLPFFHSRFSKDK